MSQDPRFIYEYAASLFPAASRLVPVFLSLLERRAFGGRCFAEAPYLIGLLVQAMVEQPELFSRLPFTGEDLREQQERARAWKYLFYHLDALLQIAWDGYLLEQSGAIDKMHLLIEQVEAEKAVPYFDDPQREARDIALVSFFCEWQRRRARLDRRMRQNRKKRQVQAARRGRR